MRAFAGYSLGFTGSVVLLLVTPFSILPGYFATALLFGGIGLFLLWVSRRIGASVRVLIILLLVSALSTFFIYGLTSRGVGLFRSRVGVELNGIVTVTDAAAFCRNSGLQGWSLVAYAQNLTAQKFTYSTRSPWDSPEKAFKYGQGYCLQQAQALMGIYDQLGIPCRLVYASRCWFNTKLADGSLVPEYIIGHAWLRVRIDGQELDVCSSDLGNRPGIVNFEILSEVRNMTPLLRPLANIAFVLDNIWHGPVS